MGTVIVIIIAAIVVWGVSDALWSDSPQNIEKKFNRAKDAMQNGHFHTCRSLCDELIHVQKSWEFYKLRGGAYFELGNYKKALQDFNASIEIESSRELNGMCYHFRDLIKRNQLA